jgi:hypothetical protein
MKLKCEKDTSAISKALNDFENGVKATLQDVGKRAVEFAVEHGEYHNVTGRLRRSNKYEVTRNGLRIYNDAPYAEEVQNRGLDVINGAALYAESELSKIVRL